jgi:hypothetical protein
MSSEIEFNAGIQLSDTGIQEYGHRNVPVDQQLTWQAA